MNDATPTELTLYANARRALAEVRRVDEVKRIRDKALALQEYGRRAKDKKLVMDAKELQLYAELRAGELLVERKAAGLEARGTRSQVSAFSGGSGSEPPGAPTLEDLGIDKKLSVRARRFAGMDRDKFEEFVEYQAAKAAATAGDKLTAHRTDFSGNNEWYTPSPYIERARRALGGIDLDPASCELAQKTVQASRFFSEEDDGLSQPWRGKVWLNPPYAQPAIERFIGKLGAEVVDRNVRAAILLTNNSTDTAWFQCAAALSAAICFTKGRIRFETAEGMTPQSPAMGQAFFYFGAEREKFAREFAGVGFIARLLE